MRSEAGARYGVEHVALAESPSTWWSAYETRLAASGIGVTSREVIAADARYIVDHGIFGAGEPGGPAWPLTRERRGLVMGAVQSGKTASMMAVAAMALDRGVDALVILAGTRTALWLQTFERFVDQIDTDARAHTRRVRIPGGLASDLPGTDLSNLYEMPGPRMNRALTRRRPIIAVVMKNAAHLERVSRNLQDVVYPLASERGEPFHLLVIDDEADDASVVDTSAVAGSRPVPRRIVDLWESRQRPGETVRPEIFATYLAYTATPQANFLQDGTNPLAPTDFVASLRTPGARGNAAVRESTFRTEDGLRGWYTGGETFYKDLADAPLCVATDDIPEGERVPDAVRAYLVAAAVRLLRSPDRLGPFCARGKRFSTSREARSAVIDPMSMLINPSAEKDEHFDTADAVMAWAGGASSGRPTKDASEGRDLGVDGIATDMVQHRDRWTAWLDSYRESANLVVGRLAPAEERPVPAADEWDSVARLILEEVVPGTRVAVINSDERADDRPEFSPRQCDDGSWRPATNLSTIFISGNVMSRGLTLEGLTTTLFTRNASTPLADTQMQMQRWFGYRGGIIDLCRVLTTRDQIDLFTHYHENDEALRRDVLRAMGSGSAPTPVILQGREFKATGKITNLRAEPLFPGPKPFVRHMNPAGSDGNNLELVASLFSGDGMVAVPSGSGQRGLLLPEALSLTEAAKLLESLAYVNHGPGPDSGEAARWRSVAHHAQIPDGDPCLPLYRSPMVAGSLDLSKDSPYTIAAYLRLWSAVVPRNVPGLLTTDDSPLMWNLVEFAARARRQPNFWVGIRFGRGEPLTAGPFARLRWPVRPMMRMLADGTTSLDADWGSRNYSGDVIQGDDLFDYVARGVNPPQVLDGRRPPGEDGLILFHLVGHQRADPTIAVGVSIPLGGPDHVRARPEAWR
jgi:hypothetical protein